MTTQNTNALDTQVGGGHYKDKKIQPVEYIHANGLGFLEGCIVKRITRWRDKPADSRFQDLHKIKHEVDLLIELESKGQDKVDASTIVGTTTRAPSGVSTPDFIGWRSNDGN